MNKSNKWEKIDISKIETSKDFNDNYYFIQDDDLMDVDYFIRGFTISYEKQNENKLKKNKKNYNIKTKLFQSNNNSPKKNYKKNTISHHKTSCFQLNKLPMKKNLNLKITTKIETDIDKFVKNSTTLSKDRNNRIVDKKNIYQRSIPGRKSDFQFPKSLTNKNTFTETETNTNINHNVYKMDTINNNTIKNKFNTIQQINHQRKLSKFETNKNRKKINLYNLNITDSYQKNFMDEIDIVFKQKIKGINDINKKFDNELSILKEYIDNSNKNNVNNIIYDSVFNDKIAEMNANEKKYIDGKQKIINKYKNNMKNVQKYFLDEIKNAVNNIKDNIPEK